MLWFEFACQFSKTLKIEIKLFLKSDKPNQSKSNIKLYMQDTQLVFFNYNIDQLFTATTRA